MKQVQDTDTEQTCSYERRTGFKTAVPGKQSQETSDGYRREASQGLNDVVDGITHPVMDIKIHIRGQPDSGRNEPAEYN